MRGWLFLQSGWTSPKAQAGTPSRFSIKFFATEGLVLVVEFTNSFLGSVYRLPYPLGLCWRWAAAALAKPNRRGAGRAGAEGPPRSGNGLLGQRDPSLQNRSNYSHPSAPH